MNRFFVIPTFLILSACVAFADPAEIIKQKALGIRDANNQRQAAIAGGSAAAPAPAPAPTAAPAPSGPSADQQTLINRLQHDLMGVKLGGPVPPELVTGIQTDINALIRSANKPTTNQINKLAVDISSALTNRTLQPVDMANLARDINVSVNCAVLTQARATTFATGAQTTLRNGGIGDAPSQAVNADLQAIVNEIQKNKPKLYQ
jgi:hypothetical protein